MEKPQQDSYRKLLADQLKIIKEIDKDLANEYLDKVSSTEDYKFTKDKTRSEFINFKNHEKLKELKNIDLEKLNNKELIDVINLSNELIKIKSEYKLENTETKFNKNHYQNSDIESLNYQSKAILEVLNYDIDSTYDIEKLSLSDIDKLLKNSKNKQIWLNNLNQDIRIIRVTLKDNKYFVEIVKSWEDSEGQDNDSIKKVSALDLESLLYLENIKLGSE